MTNKVRQDYLHQALESIKAFFPDVRINSATYLGEGFDNFAVMVNEETVFRFVKFPTAANFGSGMGGGLAVEVCLLPKLAEFVTVPIPDFEYIGKSEKAVTFVGYKSVPGRQFSVESWRRLTSEEKDVLTQDVGQTIAQIHAFPVEEAQACGVQIVNFFEKYQDDWKKCNQLVAGSLGEQRLKQFHILLEHYLGDKENFAYSSTLLHADFWFSHMFVNRKNRLSGVIDFSDIIIGDPDYDLLQMSIEGGEGLLRKMAQHLPDITEQRIPQIVRKARFFYRWNVLQDIIFFQETDNSDGIRDNLDLLNEIDRGMGWEY